ncbi:MAG: aminoglycoside 6-adenylyltransferase [Firmicutes bacterium]|nr:aminoglycoside 6-adenylyltransferase [Bacillota bacterium]
MGPCTREPYSDSHYDNFWNSIVATCELFRILAKQVAKEFSLSYPSNDDENMTEYLKHVRTLPRDAQGIY